MLRRRAARAAGQAIVLFAKAVTAVRADWRGIAPVAGRRVYFANPTSNADMPMIRSALPPALRRQTRPVAAADSWLATPLRAFAGREVFRAVLIDRRPGEDRKASPARAAAAGLMGGLVLIAIKRDRGVADWSRLIPGQGGFLDQLGGVMIAAPVFHHLARLIWQP
jgi:hypothetical protein